MNHIYLSRLTRLFFISISLCYVSTAVCQKEKSIKFGKISAADFENPAFKTDTSSSAIIISDIGSSIFEGNSDGWFTLIFKRHTRIFIKNKNGYDLATIEMPVYSNGRNEEKITGLKANTYNLENGQVVTTTLDNKSVYEEKQSKNWKIKKFAMPAIKEGSIIEYTYTIESPYLTNLQPWLFQGENLCLWSEYKVEIPSFFNYVFLTQGFQSFFIKTTKESSQYFNISDGDVNAYERSKRYSFNATTAQTRWVMKDVLPLKAESFISSARNYVSKIEFQLSGYRFPDQPEKPILANWQKVSEEMLKDDDFGAGLNTTAWLQDDIRDITAGASTDIEKAKKIFYYVTRNFSASSHYGKYLTSNLKQTFKRKNGNVADLNVLLTAMLIRAGFKADPVLCATKNFGRPHPYYPLLEKYNYVISRLTIGADSYLLDASESNAGFGMINSDLYNGAGRVINPDLPAIIEFHTNSINEVKKTFINIINDEKAPKQMTGVFSSQLGNEESRLAREKIVSTGEKDFWKKIKTNYGFDIEITDPAIDSLKRYEDPVKLVYAFTFPKPEDEIIYFNPLLGEGYSKNPFASAERVLPIEMPYATNETYIVNMEVPEGYTIDEFPKSVRMSLNGDEGMFEYIIGKTSANSFQLRNIIKLNKTDFDAEDYNSLREFFGAIVAKHAEFVVFKKKK